MHRLRQALGDRRMKNSFGVDFMLAFQANIGDCLFTWGDAPSFDIKAFSLRCNINLRAELFA